MKQPLIYRLVKSVGVDTMLATMPGFLKLIARSKGIKVQLEGKKPVETITLIEGNRHLRVSFRHLIYCYDIVNNFDYYFSAVQNKTMDGIQVVDYSKPAMHTLTELDLAFYFTSFAEPLDTTDIYIEKAALKAGDVVFDLGSYCGASSWAFSKAVGSQGRVISLEPDSENFQALNKNIKLHSLQNVTPVNKGIWSSTTKLYFQGEGNMGSAIKSILGRESNVYEVDVISLDDMCQEYEVTHVEFIKMDIEGSEVEVLDSASDFLRRYKPRLIIEPHFINGQINTNLVCDALEKAGYSSEVIPQAGLPLPLVYAVPT